MKLNTKDLQDLVTRVSKGAGNNKLIPVTSLVNILVGDGKFMLTTTDATNYFTVMMDGVDTDEDFEVSVNVDQFTKLVQKMTSETITLQVMDRYLLVVGNGKYKIDLLIDEDGKPVKFPNNEVDTSGTNGTIKVSTIKKIISNNKASLSVESSTPCLVNYYCGDRVITTDRYKVCQTSEEMFEVPYLISPSVMELLALFSSEEINYYIDDKVIAFDGPGEYVYAPIVDGIKDMPIEVLDQLLTTEMDNKCTVSKSDLLAVLDRLSLFVSQYDKNIIYLTFAQSGLEIESKKSNGAERIEYRMREGEDYTCAIDIEMFKSQVSTSPSEDLEINYGAPQAIRFVADGVVKIVALQEDDRF